ncbi:hypothetical protein [Nonomuraea insulae]|uniref:Uncharacterized protein n=1 Tax=Nonomuraea insulae TaxID=1616787 RepID=A0ABW1CDV5_9ACTN
MEELAAGDADPALTAFELGFYQDGIRCRTPLGASWNVRFERVPPVRAFRWPKGWGQLRRLVLLGDERR